MKKVLISNECYPIELDNNLNPAPLRSNSLLRNAYCIKEESEVYINGEHKYTAKPGDIIISFMVLKIDTIKQNIFQYRENYLKITL